jgi:hypothetical protein
MAMEMMVRDKATAITVASNVFICWTCCGTGTIGGGKKNDAGDGDGDDGDDDGCDGDGGDDDGDAVVGIYLFTLHLIPFQLLSFCLVLGSPLILMASSSVSA